MAIGPGEICALVCALLWAIAVILFRKSGEHLPPFALNLIKLAFVLPLLWLTIVVLGGPLLPPIPLHEWPLLILSGVLGIAIGDTLYFRALNAIGASRIAAAQTLYSPFVIALSLLFLGERLRGLQFAGVAVVLGGILLVTWERGDDALAPRTLRRGIATGVLAVLAMALGIVIAKPLLARFDFLWIVTLRVAGGLAGMLIIAAWRRQFGALRAAYAAVTHWPTILAGGFIGTYLSTLAWLAGYKYALASIAAVLNELAAVFILPLAALFLRERVQPRQVLGVVIAIGGVMGVLFG